MSKDDKTLLKIWFGCVSVVVVAMALAEAHVNSKPHQLGPEYVTINGKQMRCVAIQVTQTEMAASCDWDAIRETD